MKCRHRSDRVDGACLACGRRVRPYRRSARITVELRNPKDNFEVIDRATGTDIELKVQIDGFVGHITIPFAKGLVSLQGIADSFSREIKR